MIEQFVYFCSPERDSQEVRIGWTADLEKRLKKHAAYGLFPIAIVRADKEDEGRLHKFFEPFLHKRRDESTYRGLEVETYARRLVEWNYACGDFRKSVQLPHLPWHQWCPETVNKPLQERNGQLALFVTEGIASDVRDNWQTPSDVIELCRMALGGTIDLDPASCFEANERVKAKHFYTSHNNGLLLPWHGSVFLNPPYGGGRTEPLASLFINKLADELEAGRVRRAITVLNLQSVPTLWFPTVIKTASSHAVFMRRINFIGPRAKSGSGAPRFASSKNGTIFSFYGEGRERFEEMFKFPTGWPIRSVADL